MLVVEALGMVGSEGAARMRLEDSVPEHRPGNEDMVACFQVKNDGIVIRTTETNKVGAGCC